MSFRSEEAKKRWAESIKDRESNWINWLTSHNATIAYISGYCGIKKKCLHACLIHGCQFYASPNNVRREFSQYKMFCCPECAKDKSRITGKDDAQNRFNAYGIPVKIIEWNGIDSEDSVYECPRGHLYKSTYRRIYQCSRTLQKGCYWSCPTCMSEIRREKAIAKINDVLCTIQASPLNHVDIKIAGQSNDYYSSIYSCGHTEIRRIGKWGDKIHNIHPVYQQFCQMCNHGSDRMSQRVFVDALMQKTGHTIVVEFPLEGQNLKIDAFDLDTLTAYEWDGIFHNKSVQVNRDTRKNEYLKSIGIKLVRIDATKKELYKGDINDRIACIRSVVDSL